MNLEDHVLPNVLLSTPRARTPRFLINSNKQRQEIANLDFLVEEDHERKSPENSGKFDLATRKLTQNKQDIRKIKSEALDHKEREEESKNGEQGKSCENEDLEMGKERQRHFNRIFQNKQDQHIAEKVLKFSLDFLDYLSFWIPPFLYTTSKKRMFEEVNYRLS